MEAPFSPPCQRRFRHSGGLRQRKETLSCVHGWNDDESKEQMTHRARKRGEKKSVWGPGKKATADRSFFFLALHVGSDFIHFRFFFASIARAMRRLQFRPFGTPDWK